MTTTLNESTGSPSRETNDRDQKSSDLRFRFKSKKRRSGREDDELNRRRPKRSKTSPDSNPNSHQEKDSRPRRRPHKHHRRGRRKPGRSQTPPPPPPKGSTNQADGGLSPETAFRESLFDALADDEGAEYWESIYGQPIHTYSNMHPSLNPSGDKGELERMTEDEYVAYVRAQMWERTSEAAAEERARRAREREAQSRKERIERDREQFKAQLDEERDAFAARMEESLRWGANRKARREKDAIWKAAWARYVSGWEALGSSSTMTTRSTSKHAADDSRKIPWPVRSGKMSDVAKDEVEEFFRRAAAEAALRQTGSGTSQIDKNNALRALLKAERVRWHPDKMMQRFGGGEALDPSTIKAVTAVFQLVDAMFTANNNSVITT